MFAGPNGSGKSVLKSYLPESLLGVYLNPDEIEAGIKKSGYADIHRFGIQTTQEEILSAFAGSKFLQEKGFSDAARSLSFEDGRLFFTSDVGNSYFASVLVDFIRGKLLKVRQTFTLIPTRASAFRARSFLPDLVSNCRACRDSICRLSAFLQL
jgi:hypothetical protein